MDIKEVMQNLDIEAVKECYYEYKKNYEHYEKIDKYYYGNVDKLKRANKKKWQSDFHCVDNFFQTFVDQEAQYSFGNEPTYSYLDEDIDIGNIINYYINNKHTYNSLLGQKLVEFTLIYELNFIGKNGFTNKIITPMEGNFAFNEYEEPLFFIYIHTKRVLDKNIKGKNKYNIVDYIDVYDDKYVYYLDNNFNFREGKPPVEHGFPCIPVGIGLIGGKYTTENGYIEGDKSLYRMIKTNQDAYCQIKTCGVQEIIDFRNSILKTYGIKLQEKKKPIYDNEGNITKWELIKDEFGNPEYAEPVLENTNMLHFKDKSVSDAEWLIKDIPNEFIDSTLKRCRDDIHSLTNHIDSNEKLQSNLSGVKMLPSKLEMV